METITDFNSQDPTGGAPAPGGSKLGKIGLAVTILGFIIYCGPLALAFILGATGNGPAAGDPIALVLGGVSYCGAFIGLIGAVIGGISLARGEDKTLGIISIVLGALTLCACVMLAIIGAAIMM